MYLLMSPHPVKLVLCALQKFIDCWLHFWQYLLYEGDIGANVKGAEKAGTQVLAGFDFSTRPLCTNLNHGAYIKTKNTLRKELYRDQNTIREVFGDCLSRL